MSASSGPPGSNVTLSVTGYPSDLYLRSIYILFDTTSYLDLDTLVNCTVPSTPSTGFGTTCDGTAVRPVTVPSSATSGQHYFYLEYSDLAHAMKVPFTVN